MERNYMLVLSRRLEESIIINNDTQVAILGVNGNKVCLGITAPKHIPVHRKEIHDRNKKKKRQEGTNN